MEAEPVEIGAEPRFLAGHAEIGDKREAEPAADRCAMDCADHRLRGAEQADRFLVEMPAAAAAGGFLHGAGIHALRKIGTGAEMAALGGEHDRTDRRVGVDALERLADLGDQCGVEEIVRRPAYLDRCDESVGRDGDFVEPV